MKISWYTSAIKIYISLQSQAIMVILRDHDNLMPDTLYILSDDIYAKHNN